MGWEGHNTSLEPLAGVGVGPSVFGLMWLAVTIEGWFSACLIAVVCASSLFGRGMQLEWISHQQIRKYCSSNRNSSSENSTSVVVIPAFFLEHLTGNIRINLGQIHQVCCLGFPTCRIILGYLIRAFITLN